MESLTPKQIVEELDKYIIGQHSAKKSVAIALRDRYRRSLLPKEIQDEITPKNIIMIGPTGVGKTEIARRLAKLVNAPFIKVEATKFTEVGYVGRDVESMIRDLIESSIRMVKNEKMEQVKDKAKQMAENRIVAELMPYKKRSVGARNPLEMFFSNTGSDQENENKDEEINKREKRAEILEQLRQGLLEDTYIEIEVEDTSTPTIEMFSGMGTEEMNINIQDIFGGLFPKKKKKRKLTIREARKIIEQEEAQKLIDMDEVVTLAIKPCRAGRYNFPR
jgi:ATP-dependent HslUV protease ATP-binding subunit HslU